MILDMIQLSKGLYTAEFVVNRGTEKVGSAFVQGKFTSREAEITCEFNGRSFGMRCGKRKDFQVRLPFRAYVIKEGDALTGMVGSFSIPIGGRRTIGCTQIKKAVDLMGNDIDEAAASYTMYSLCLRDGYKLPVYRGNEQIAQLEADKVVHDDLYPYRIYAKDADAALAAVQFGLYTYMYSDYKPGQKKVHYVEKYISPETKEPALLEKFHPDFARNMEP